jgi:glycosyltransferase involved in cell wall biosynthesis
MDRNALPSTRARPLKVAILTPAWPVGAIPNGIVTYAAHIVPALRAKGAEVYVVTSVDGSQGADPYVSVPGSSRGSLTVRALGRLHHAFSPGAPSERRDARSISRELLRLEREHGLDLIEMEESFGWCGVVAATCATPVVARLHGPWFLNGAMIEDTTTRAFRRRVRREGEAVVRVAGVSAPSRDVLERTRARYGHALADAEVIPNPLPQVPAAEHWNARKCEPGTLLFVGRFDRHKAGDVAIEAFARIRAVEPRARLIFAGPDPGVTDDSGRRWRVREFLDDRLPRAEDRAAVEYLGAQPPAAIRALRVRAAVTLVCSRWENFPYTLGEAMSFGCPVVATATGGLVELVSDGQNGLLARPDDPADLARAALELLRDPERAARLGALAAQTSATQLSPEAIADQTLAFYRRVLARRG